MTTIAAAEFIAELEDAVKARSPERRFQMLRRIMGLFLSSSGRLNQHQVGVFDDVLVRLITPTDARTLAQLSSTLSDLTSVPKATVRRLACHDDATVAAPVLLKSESLSENDLIEIAGNRSQQHLLAISGRRTLNEALTDTILMRGDTNVCRALAKNAGARFSDRGYQILVAAAERDDDIAESLVLRPDIQVEMLRELLSKATTAVRVRLLEIARPEMRRTIHAAIEDIEARAGTKVPEPIDYSEAKSRVVELNKAGKLNDSTVNRFVVHGERTTLVAALSLLATTTIETIESLMEDSDCLGLLVVCRASRLNWTTTLAVISSRSGAQRVPPRELERFREAFEALCLSTAQWTIRFGSVRDFAVKSNLKVGALQQLG
jgi:uncharacterized protein (DUF2336 family)